MARMVLGRLNHNRRGWRLLLLLLLLERLLRKLLLGRLLLGRLLLHRKGLLTRIC